MIKSVTLISVVMVTSYLCMVSCDVNSMQSQKNQQQIISRTFVHHAVKRLLFLLLPLMFKFGVLSSMIAVIKAVSVKGLFIGVALLILGLSHVLAKSYEAQKLHLPLHSSPYIYHTPLSATFPNRRNDIYQAAIPINYKSFEYAHKI